MAVGFAGALLGGHGPAEPLALGLLGQEGTTGTQSPRCLWSVLWLARVVYPGSVPCLLGSLLGWAAAPTPLQGPWGPWAQF